MGSYCVSNKNSKNEGIKQPEIEDGEKHEGNIIKSSILNEKLEKGKLL